MEECDTGPLLEIPENSKKKSILIIISFTLAGILLISTIIVGILLSSKSSDYNELLTKYNNQNSTMNDVFNTMHDLIANTTMPSTIIDKAYYTNVKKKVNEMKGYDDGTYDFITKEKVHHDKGYQVGFETHLRYYDNYYTDEGFDNIVYKIAALLGVNADLGVYEHIPGVSYFIEDKQLALSIAALFNQQSVWDWKANKILLNSLHQSKYY